jgi:uncharacterized cupredoxin-like copper-binding protein
MRPGRLVSAVAMLGLTVPACGGGGGGDTEVKVGLNEYKVTPNPVEVKSGTLRFEADNLGSIKHEMVMVRAKDAAALAKDATGAVDEEKIAESDKMGELADIAAGAKKAKSFKLAPGSYVIFCNITDQNPDGTTLNHFKQGMSETFTVN